MTFLVCMRGQNIMNKHDVIESKQYCDDRNNTNIISPTNTYSNQLLHQPLKRMWQMLLILLGHLSTGKSCCTRIGTVSHNSLPSRLIARRCHLAVLGLIAKSTSHATAANTRLHHGHAKTLQQTLPAIGCWYVRLRTAMLKQCTRLSHYRVLC